MKNYKRITSLAIASLMVTSATVGFAAPKDVYNTDKSVYKTAKQMAVSELSQRKVSLRPNSYLFEGNNGELFTFKQAEEAFTRSGKDFLSTLETEYVPVGNVNDEKLKVESVSAINNKKISVIFENMETPVEIELEQTLNHGQNLVKFTYNEQSFEAIVTYVDENVVEIETAIKAAEEAVKALDGVEVTMENKNIIAEQIGGARALIQKAQELDKNVVFDTYPLEQLEAKISELNDEVDSLVAAANKAIADLPAVEDVNFENKETVATQVSEARALVVKAMAIDKNVVFNTYQIEQLEAKLEGLKQLKINSVSAINANKISVTFEGMEEAVEIELDEALNHGQNLVTFTYEGQTFEVMITYVDENVVEIEAAIKAAEEAIESLNDFGEVTPENKAAAIQAIADVQALIDKAQELDANVTFNKYPMEQLQEKINGANAQVDAKVAEANAAIAELDKIDLETVTIADRTDLIEKVANARALIAEAKEMDSNVSFDTYAIEQAEAKIAEFNTQIDTKVAAAQEAIDELDVYEKATNGNKAEIQEKINSAEALIDEVKEMDPAVSFNTYQLEKLQAEIDALNVTENKLKAVNDAKTPYEFNKALKAAGIENVNSNEALLNKYNTTVKFESLNEVQAKVDLVNSLEGNVLTGTPVEINETIRGDIEINHTGDLRLNGKTIDGTVTIKTTKVGTINLEAGTIKGNLDVTVPNGTVINNSATIEGTVTINGHVQGFSFRTMFARAASGIVWNEKADGNKIVNNAENAEITIAEGKKVESLELEAPTTLKVEKGASFKTPVVVKADSTIISEEAVPAKIDDEVILTVKTDEKDEGVEVPGTGSGEEVDVTFAAAEKLVSDYEAAVKDKDAVLNLVTDDANRNKVSALKTPAFNKVQLVKGEEKQALLNRLDVAHDKLIAATAVKGLQNATKNVTLDNLDNAKIKLSNAKTNVKKLVDGDIKTALNELVKTEETQITKLETAITAVELAEKTKSQVDVEAARAEINALKGSQAKIALQARIDEVQTEINKVLADAIGTAEKAIEALPTVKEVKISDKALVQKAKEAVAAVKALDEDVTVDGEEVIAELEEKIAELELTKAKDTKKESAYALLTDLDKDEYTEESWAALTYAIEVDKEAIDSKTTVTEVEEYTLTATAAKADLVITKEASEKQAALNVKNEKELNASLESEYVTEIKLANDFTLTKAIYVNKAVTIDGNSKTITVKTEGVEYQPDQHGINIMGEEVVIKNLTVTGAKGSGIQIFNNATIENVTSKANSKAGFYVNNDSNPGKTITVNFKDIKTSENVWDAGVGIVAQKQDSNSTVNFTGKNSFDETVKVYSDGGNESVIETYKGTVKVKKDDVEITGIKVEGKNQLVYNLLQ